MSRLRRCFSNVFFVDVKHRDKNSEKEPRWKAWMLVIAFAVILVLICVASLQFWLVNNFVNTSQSDQITRFGISGDFFGFANALFSALAFAMIIVTLWMQKYELSQQREELEITREVFLQQKEEMKEQNDSLRRQRFESTFFGMLELHNQVVSEIASASGKKRGREAIEDLASSLDPSFTMLGGEYNRKIAERSLEKRIADYESWYDDNEHHVGHYFRTLYNIIRYIDEWGDEDKATYTRLVRAQMSRGELELLLHNGLSRYGQAKFKPLIEKYGLLKHVKETKEHKIVGNGYNPSAFGLSFQKEIE